MKDNELKQADITFDDKLRDQGRDAARRVPCLRAQPHDRRRGRVSAEAQDSLHRRCLRERRVQLHGPLELRGLDQVLDKMKARHRHRSAPVTASSAAQGPARDRRSDTSPSCATRSGRGSTRKSRSTTSPRHSTCPGTRNGPARMRKRFSDNIKYVYDELTGKIDHDKLGSLPYRPRWPLAEPAVELTGFTERR